MRLEDALVINEPCAGEIVTAAINAVGADPAMVAKIVETAMNVAPRRAGVIEYAVTHFSPEAPPARAYEEVRRPELPEGMRAVVLEEVRRAEAPSASVSAPLEEVRRAEVPVTAAVVPASAPMASRTEEVRRAVVPVSVLHRATNVTLPSSPQLSSPRKR